MNIVHHSCFLFHHLKKSSANCFQRRRWSFTVLVDTFSTHQMKYGSSYSDTTMPIWLVQMKTWAFKSWSSSACVTADRSQSLLPELATEEENATITNVESLSSWYSDEIRYMYWKLPTVSGEIVSVFQLSYEEQQSTGRPLHDMKAWVEVYLITRSRSTFGYVAQGLGGIRPWILAKPENQTVPNPPCQRAMSMEPCFHSPPSYDCKAKKNADLGALVPFLKHCEDVPSGIKLLDVDSV